MFKLTKHFDKTLAKKVQTPNFPQHTHLIHMQLSDLKPHKLHKRKEHNQITRIPSQNRVIPEQSEQTNHTILITNLKIPKSLLKISDTTNHIS